MEQMTLFELMQQVSDFPCDDCVFDAHGCCSHIENEECFCVMGSFQIKNSAIICPACGHSLLLRHAEPEAQRRGGRNHDKQGGITMPIHWKTH